MWDVSHLKEVEFFFLNRRNIIVVNSALTCAIKLSYAKIVQCFYTGNNAQGTCNCDEFNVYMILLWIPYPRMAVTCPKGVPNVGPSKSKIFFWVDFIDAKFQKMA